MDTTVRSIWISAAAHDEQSRRVSVSFPTAVDRFITLWEIAGDMMEDPIIREATEALKAGSGVSAGTDGHALAEANKELLTLHELIGHRLVQLLLGLHRGRKVFS
jgi:xylose isomerase